MNFDIDNICAQKDDCFECKNNVNNENLQKYGKNDEKMVKNNAFLSKIQARTDAKKLQRKIHKDFARKEKENLNNRLQFGLVFQSFNLFPHYNVGQNIFMPSELQNRRIVEDFKAEMIAQKEFDKQHINALVNAKKKELDDCSKENVDRLLAKVGLRDKKLSYPCELSGGQQQRVAIARALALSPNILCFDEPTSALDPELTGEVLKVIKGLKDNYMTMIVVTHEMDFAKNVADKVIFMQDGIIVEQGEPRQMFENPQSDGLKSFLQKSSESV
ncbi:MAG: ATP-binding cassette domain-containing protein [Clostridia bacterium]